METPHLLFQKAVAISEKAILHIGSAFHRRNITGRVSSGIYKKQWTDQKAVP